MDASDAGQGGRSGGPQREVRGQSGRREERPEERGEQTCRGAAERRRSDGYAQLGATLSVYGA